MNSFRYLLKLSENPSSTSMKKNSTSGIVDKVSVKILDAAALPIFARTSQAYSVFFNTFAVNISLELAGISSQIFKKSINILLLEYYQ